MTAVIFQKKNFPKEYSNFPKDFSYFPKDLSNFLSLVVLSKGVFLFTVRLQVCFSHSFRGPEAYLVIFLLVAIYFLTFT